MFIHPKIVPYIDTLLHTWADWLFDGKWVKYIELYTQMPANSMSVHIREIILFIFCSERFIFVWNEKSPSHFMPIGSSRLIQMP